MMRRLRRIIRGWFAEKADTLLTALVFLLFAALLSLTGMFNGGDAVAEKLSQTIPFHFRYENIFFLSPHYTFELDNPYLNNLDFAKEEPELYAETINRMMDGFDRLGRDENVTYYNYNLYLTAVCVPLSAEDDTAPEDGFNNSLNQLFGVSSLRFFEENGLMLLSNTNPSGFNEDGIFVPDTSLVVGADGELRKMQPGDRWYCYTSTGDYIRTLTVQGVYHFQKKFDYNYGDDIFFNSGAPIVSNETLRRSFLCHTDDMERMLPQINYPQFRIGNYHAFADFRQKMQAVCVEIRDWCMEQEVNMPKLIALEPQYKNVLRSSQSMSRIYSIVLLVVDGMLVVLMIGLLYYLISKKKREMFLYYTLGAKKREIAGHYGFHYGALALISSIIGSVLGVLLNGALSSKVSSDTISLQNALIRYSNNGQMISRNLRAASFFDTNPANLARGAGIGIAGTILLALAIGLIGSAILLRGNLRNFARGSE